MLSKIMKYNAMRREAQVERNLLHDFMIFLTRFFCASLVFVSVRKSSFIYINQSLECLLLIFVQSQRDMCERRCKRQQKVKVQNEQSFLVPATDSISFFSVCYRRTGNKELLIKLMNNEIISRVSSFSLSVFMQLYTRKL